MQRRNFLMKILVAIPFVGLAIASAMKGPKLWTAKLDDPSEAISPLPFKGCAYDLASERAGFSQPVNERLPEAIAEYVMKNHYYPHDLTHAEWSRYIHWKNGKCSVVSRESDSYTRGQTHIFGLLYGTN